ncbi:hypothetical protein HispidOSU_000126, partial [Sigmodon hispidus]
MEDRNLDLETNRTIPVGSYNLDTRQKAVCTLGVFLSKETSSHEEEVRMLLRCVFSVVVEV